MPPPEVVEAAAPQNAPIAPPPPPRPVAVAAPCASLPSTPQAAAAPAVAAPSNAAPAAVPLAPIGSAAIKAAAKSAAKAVRSAAFAEAVLHGNVLVERGLKQMWTEDNWSLVWVCARCGLGNAACGLNPKPGVANQCIAAGPRTKKPKRDDHFIPW